MSKQTRNLVFYASGTGRKSSAVPQLMQLEEETPPPPFPSSESSRGMLPDLKGPTEERYRRVSTEELLQEVTKKLEFVSREESLETLNDNNESELEEAAEEGERTENEEHQDYPYIHLSPTGTLSVRLRDGRTVEVSLNGNIRVVLRGSLAVGITKDSAVVGVMHRHTRILQECHHFMAQFGRDKLVFGHGDNVLCTSKRMKESYLLNHGSSEEPKVVPSAMLLFPSLGTDFTQDILRYQMILERPKTTIAKAKGILLGAHYEEDGEETTIHLNGCVVKERRDGTLEVSQGPRNITIHPQGHVFLKTDFILLSVEGDEKASVMWGKKKVNSTKNSLAVSDGHHLLTMDGYGKLV